MSALLTEQDALDERAEDHVGSVEVRADDRTGDDDDDAPGQHLALIGPVDLLQLTPALGEEASAAAPLALGGLRRYRFGRRPDRLLARQAALRSRAVGRGRL